LLKSSYSAKSKEAIQGHWGSESFLEIFHMGVGPTDAYTMDVAPNLPLLYSFLFGFLEHKIWNNFSTKVASLVVFQHDFSIGV